MPEYAEGNINPIRLPTQHIQIEQTHASGFYGKEEMQDASDVYDEERSTDYYNMLVDIIGQTTFFTTPIGRKTRVLEVGCSTGVFTPAILAFFNGTTMKNIGKEVDYVGLDSFETAVEYARRNAEIFPEFAANVRYLIGDARNLEQLDVNRPIDVFVSRKPQIAIEDARHRWEADPVWRTILQVGINNLTEDGIAIISAHLIEDKKQVENVLKGHILFTGTYREEDPMNEEKYVIVAKKMAIPHPLYTIKKGRIIKR